MDLTGKILYADWTSKPHGHSLFELAVINRHGSCNIITDFEIALSKSSKAWGVGVIPLATVLLHQIENHADGKLVASR